MLTSTSLTLVLGATGKTGSRVANKLLSRGLPVRTAARSGADAHFDWDDPETYAPALHGVERVYLLGPVMRTDFADQVSVFLDQAETAGARHITYLSAYGTGSAPPETAMRSVELDLLGRPGPHPRHPATGVVHAELQRDLSQANRRRHRGSGW